MMLQRDLFPTSIYLRQVDPARNRRRFYAMSVQRDLFGDWTLVREWGRIGRPGRLRADGYGSLREAQSALARLELTCAPEVPSHDMRVRR